MVNPFMFRFICASMAGASTMLFGAGSFLAAESAINEHTVVPIIFLVAAVIFVGGLMWKIRGWVERIEKHLDQQDCDEGECPKKRHKR